MLPVNIKNVVSTMLTETKEGKIEWEYDSFLSKISAKYKDIDIDIQYKFDFDNEISSFSLDIIRGGKTYPFKETAYESDYDLINRLYQEAIASDFGDFT